MHENVIHIYKYSQEPKFGKSSNSEPDLDFLKHFLVQNVMLLYICVSVVLIWSLCRKEREKLYITLDSMVIMLARVQEIQ
jgi:hypothetical protein